MVFSVDGVSMKDDTDGMDESKDLLEGNGGTVSDKDVDEEIGNAVLEHVERFELSANNFPCQSHWRRDILYRIRCCRYFGAMGGQILATNLRKIVPGQITLNHDLSRHLHESKVAKLVVAVRCEQVEERFTDSWSHVGL